MKFFFIIGLFTAFLLGTASEIGLLKKMPASPKTPEFLAHYKRSMRASFDRPENVHIIFAMITGNKNGISPYTKAAFKKLNLSFLLSPSGVHLAGLFLFVNFLLQRIPLKWMRTSLKSLSFFSLFFLPNFEAIKRLAGLRLLFQFKFLSKLKIQNEHLFFITFFISFLMGDFKNSPLGFIYSFAFLGTFFSLKTYPKITLILGLYLIQLILGLFLGEKVSLMAIICGLIGSYLFSFLFPVILIFLGSFWIVSINWVEPLIRGFVVLIHATAKMVNGSFTSASLFLILAIWILMLPKHFKGKYGTFALLFFLHTNAAMTPAIFTSN